MTEITAVLSSENGYFHEGYADSIAVTDSRLYVRENYGVSVYGHGLVPLLAQQWDIQGRPGYAKVGDGFQTISNVGTSPDGQRVLLGYKQDTHGTLVLDARYSGNHAGRDGTIIGEFAPPRALGGVACVQIGGAYVGFALAGTTLAICNVSSETLGKVSPKYFSAERGSQQLTGCGDHVAYVTGLGNIVLAWPNGTQQTTPAQASCLSYEAWELLAGGVGGMWRVGGARQELPSSPSAVCLLHGVAYAMCYVGGTQRLYREGTQILELPPDTWPTVQMKGFGNQLYLATTKNVLVVKVG